MTKKFKKLLIGALSAVMILPIFATPTAFAEETTDSNDTAATTSADNTFSVAAKAAISVDFESGKVFYDQDSQKAMGIASITKIISIYLVEQQIKEGKLKMDEVVPISDYTEWLSTQPDLSNVPLHKENQYTVKQLLHASIIQSGNAAIAALAERVAGSEPAFVDLMKKQLEAWGIKDANLVNASGLNNKYLGTHLYPNSAKDAENTMSARDVAIVARHLIKNFPEVLDISKITTEKFGEGTQSPVEMVNWNWMLPGFVSAKSGVDGLKTGTTDLAGACFVGTINKDNQRIITVVLNATNHKNDPAARFQETSKLMDWTYANWSQKEVMKAGNGVPEHKKVDVLEGKELTTPISLKDPVTLWVRSDMDESQITVTPNFSKKAYATEVQAPVEKGMKLGTATVAMTADNLGYLDEGVQPTSEIVVDQSVEKANFFVLIGRNIKNFFTNLF